MLTEKEIINLDLLRRKTFFHIRTKLGNNDCKSYEGSFSISFPTFEEEQSNNQKYTLKLDLYVFGPAKHYSWTEKTLLEAIKKADKDISSWIK